MYLVTHYEHSLNFLKFCAKQWTLKYVISGQLGYKKGEMYRVRTGPGIPGKSMNF